MKVTRNYEDFLKAVPGAAKEINIRNELEW